MPKLPALTPKTIVKILVRLGFQLDHKTGSHFIFYNPRTKRIAVIPYHKKDLPKETLMSILRQAGITKDELDRLL